MTVSYPAASNVAIWLGSFESEDALDAAVDRDVASRLNLKIDLSRIAEQTFSDQPSSVRALLEGFSGWQTFIEEAVAIADVKEFSDVNSAFVCYHLHCADAPATWGCLHFPRMPSRQ